jgi:hypothetical protein
MQTVSAMTAVRDKYQLVKDWMGDPCLPKNFAWKGLGCSYAVSSPAIVTGLWVTCLYMILFRLTLKVALMVS